MPAAKLVFGIPIMVELDLFPVLLRMAVGALAAIAPEMYVVDRVAYGTLCGDLLVALVRVARGAFDLAVLSAQGKVGLVVIETRFLAP